MDYQYIGKNFPASDAEAKAGGAMTFTEDMALPNMAYMKLVLSPAAHGIVRRWTSCSGDCAGCSGHPDAGQHASDIL